ncbi:MlaD family protein [Rhodoferax sp.]|uniref:MlaD family protein n=1 Tax=Rhodoferax sp. TaxID=50421 RepID=UPI00260A1F8C|nr:MlaD family protein [Rhodoferax sp.]MDD2810585.1 MlaD family protein [Rhodoferax sp.]
MENKSHAVAAGSFVLLLTAVLMALAVWLTRDTRALVSYELAGAVNVSGLQPQASVRYLGVPVGKVSAIGLDPLTPGQVLVQIAVEDSAPITSRTTASLGFQGVTGLAFIQLDDAPLAATAASPSRLPQHSRLLLKPGLMSTLADRGERLLGQLEQSAQRANQLLAPDHQQALMTAVRQIGLAAAELQQLSAQTRNHLPALAQASQDTLAVVKATAQRVGDSADAARTSARAFQRVTERMFASGGTLDQFSQFTEVWVATGQAVRHRTVPELELVLQGAQRTTQGLNELANTLADQPQALLLGKPAAEPGPGEPGFAPPAVPHP